MESLQIPEKLKEEMITFLYTNAFVLSNVIKNGVKLVPLSIFPSKV